MWKLWKDICIFMHKCIRMVSPSDEKTLANVENRPAGKSPMRRALHLSYNVVRQVYKSSHGYF